MAAPPTLTTRGVTIAALLITLGQPAWWLLALAGFLARGGIIVFLLAIVSVPSPLVLSNILGPLVTPLAFGTVLPGTVLLIVVAIGLGLCWLIGGGWFGAATEVALMRAAAVAAVDEGLPGTRGPTVGRRVVGRVALAHLVAHVPTALVAGVASIAIVQVTYVELTNPSDAGPIALRVVAAAARPIGAIVFVWALGEIIGGLAAREIALGDRSLAAGLGRALGAVARRPIGALVMPSLTLIVLAVDLAALLAIVAVVLAEVRDRLARTVEDPFATGLTVATLAAAWSLALIVTGLITAWRGVALTFETQRLASAAPVLDVTNGASAHRRPGDRSPEDVDGNL
ncbi:MAG: hypothetical protein QOF49_961 [Chloroflexota bacterium]|jgi:hypothetical protein|nr:hypothetical protein [Chloroflexota bacterium]